MNAPRQGWQAAVAVSGLAALSTWVALWAWSGFSERPSSYLLPLLGGCALVAVSGAALRSVRLVAPVVAAGQVLVVLVWLTHRWAADEALAGWVPTPASLGEMGSTLQTAAAAARAYAAPVPGEIWQLAPLMTALGVGAALLVDLLACGLRRVPLAGLPLLAVYAAPLNIAPDGVTWWKFAAGAVCFLLLLSADETDRLTHWGRQLSSSHVVDTQAPEVSTEGMRSAARKIGLTATGLAVAVPLVVPTLSLGLFGGGSGPGGNGDAVSISNPMVDLKRDLVRGADRNLVWVNTPDPDPSYLRVAVLDSFDGEAWRPSGRDIPVTQRADGHIPTPVGLEPDVPRTKVPYEIRIDRAFASRWLPTPYPVASVRAPGDWRYDTSTLDFISAVDGQTTAGESYRLRALELHPDASTLASAGPAQSDVYAAFTELPGNLPGSVRRLARQVTSGEPTRFEQAVALQQWFRRGGGFTYSLERAPGDGIDQLEHFLGTGPGSRVGYCQQFAAAMAVMGRTLGIPSRVAVGFLQPEKVGAREWVFSSHDLHAWPEMYFEGTGWVRFEPTPAARAAEVPPYTDQRVDPQRPDVQPDTTAPLPQRDRLDNPQTPHQPRTTRPGAGGGSGGHALLVGLLVALGLGLLGVLPRLAREAVGRRRWRRAQSPAALAEAAWRELHDSAVDLGLSWDDSVTLRTRARDLARSFGASSEDAGSSPVSSRRGADANPEAARALDRVVRLLEQARYARTTRVDGTTDTLRAGLQRDVHDCVAALRLGAGRGQRLRARWLPTSLAGDLAGGGRRTARAYEGATSRAGVDHAV